MTVFLYILLVACAAAILVLHALSVFGQSRCAKLASTICIAAHVILFTTLLLLDVSTENAVLAFLFSLLWYCALSSVQYIRTKKAASSEEVNRP